MGIVTTEWSASRSLSSLVRVMAWQTGSGGTPSNSLIILGQHLTLDGSNNYTSSAATTNYSVAGACSSASITSGRPIDCVDAFAYAPYYDGAQIRATDSSYNNTMTDAVTAADNYASGNPVLMSTALDFVDCDVRGVTTATYPNCGLRNGTLGPDTLASFPATYSGYDTLATTWGKVVIEYEGGLQIAAPSASRLTTLGITSSSLCGTAACISTEFANLIAAYKNDPRFKQLAYDQFQQFMSYGNSRIPSWYELGPNSTQWDIFPGANFNVTPAYQSFNGVQRFTSGQ